VEQRVGCNSFVSTNQNTTYNVKSTMRSEKQAGLEACGQGIYRTKPASGALVVSLDFELHWGVRDHRPLDTAERTRLLSARRVVPRLLDLFEEFGIHATWATVGLLFAESEVDIKQFTPRLQPNYAQPAFSPYSEPVGVDESDDPFHYAPSLIREIARRPGQEVASHSFSHYYCMEKGQTLETFQSDMHSALAIAAEYGYQLESYVFPRNQVDESHLSVIESAGISCYRGPESTPADAPQDFQGQRRLRNRLARLADTYVNLFGARTFGWPAPDRLVSIPGSRYLAPVRSGREALEGLRRQRIIKSMTRAALNNEIFHIWCHPEDFAYKSDLNLAFLHSLLTAFDQLRTDHGMLSLSMAEASGPARQSLQLVSN
jgi:peptidoglycan/xylan/chitin deacetylase (PgdA/CDA1 family)